MVPRGVIGERHRIRTGVELVALNQAYLAQADVKEDRVREWRHGILADMH